MTEYIECEGRTWELLGHPDTEQQIAFVRDGGQHAVLKLIDDVWTWHHYGTNVSSGRSKIGPERRRYVYERDHWRCRYCGVAVAVVPHGKVQKATLDHIVPKSKDGTHDEDNLVTACSPCNWRKKDMTLEEAGMTLLPIQPALDDRDTRHDREY